MRAILRCRHINVFAGIFVIAGIVATAPQLSAHVWQKSAPLPPSVTPIDYELTPPSDVFACSATGCDSCTSVGEATASNCCHRCFDPNATTVFPEDNPIDNSFESVLGFKDVLGFPLEVAAWHWWAIDTSGGGGGGYGFRNYRGTYAYTLRGGPEYEIDDDQSIGAYGYYGLRDDDPYRTYYPDNFWFLEGYGWYRNKQWGTLKGGLMFMNFGLGGYGNFIGTTSYFEGYIQDPDYGLAWEKTWNVQEDFSIDTSMQYYFHEDGKNGSLLNFDSESVAGVNEKNTFVMRGLGKWTLGEDSSLNLGSSVLVGQIDSNLAGFNDDVRTTWGVDMNWTQGRFVLRSEFLQRFGRVVPTHFVSGGPSDRMEAYSFESSYNLGAVTLRGKWSESFLQNPNARQEILSLGGQVNVTPNIILFAEYAWWDVYGNAAGDFNVIEGPQLVVYWHY